jgi:hypothetical protein
MKSMHRIVFVAILGSVLLVSGLSRRAAAAIIVNGDFDSSVPSNGTGGGWTSLNIDSAGGWRSTGGNSGGVFILNDNGNAPDPTIMQLVTGLTAGVTYRLTGDYANEHQGTGANTFAVDVDGVTLDKLDYPGPGVWGSFSFDITASDTDLLIAFRAEIDGSDTDYKIDNISLVDVNAETVPEPASLAIWGLGALGCAVAAHRRKRVTA